MRIRTVKPEFHQSATLATLPREVRGFAAALLNWADDEGYFVSIPAVIAGSLYPFDADGREFVSASLPKLEAIGYLELFEGSVGVIPGLPLHQRINRPTKSKLKAKALKRLNLTESSVSPHTQLSEPSLLEGKGREGKGNGTGKGKRKGKGSAEPVVSQPAQVELPQVVPPTPPRQRAPTRIGALHGFFLEMRGIRFTAPAPDGLDLGTQAPADEDPDWSRSAAALSIWVKRWPGLSEDEQDRMIRAVITTWLEEPYWASPKPKEGKPGGFYPWGAFISGDQFSKAADKCFTPEAA